MSLSLWTYYDRGSGSLLGPPYGALVYAESQDSGYCHIGDDDSSGTNVYQTDYSEFLNFVDACKGYPVYVDEEGGDYSISRELPQEHPLLQGFYCSDIDVKPVVVTGTEMGTSKAGTWKLASMNTVFRPVDYAVLADDAIGDIDYTVPPTLPDGGNNVDCPNELNRFVSRTYNIVLQTIQNQTLMQFVQRNTNKALNSSPSQAYAFLEAEYTWHAVPARTVGYSPFTPPNIATVLACAAKVNEAVFDGRHIGTVLFVGYSPKLRKPNLDTGLYTWDLTYRFVIMDNGFINSLGIWAGPNCILDTNPGAGVVGVVTTPLPSRWDLITNNGRPTGNTLYQEVDLNALFNITLTG